MTTTVELNHVQAEIILEALDDLRNKYADKASEAFCTGRESMEDYYVKEANKVENVKFYIEAETADIIRLAEEQKRIEEEGEEE